MSRQKKKETSRGVTYTLKFILLFSILFALLVNTFIWNISGLSEIVQFVEQNESNELPSNQNLMKNGTETQTPISSSIVSRKKIRDESETKPLSSPSSLHQRSTNRNSTGAFLTMYGAHRVQPSLEKLPSWLQHYVSKHRVENMYNNSEKYIVLTCFETDRCGGFSDRLRSLPFYLLFGSLAQRSICIHWDKPFGLEKFLEPPPGGLNWRCPSNFRELVNPKISSLSQPNVRTITVGNKCNKANPKTCTEDTLKELRKIDDQFIIVRTKSQAFDKINILNTYFLGHSYKKNFPSVGQWSHVNLMGDIFRVMFQPVESLSRRVNTTMKILGLKEKEYTSVHVRSHYPTKAIKGIAARQLNISSKELKLEESIRFEGNMKKHLIDVTTNAFHCDSILNPLPVNTTPTIYICSDSNELVNHFVTHGVHISGRQTPIIPVAHQNKTGKLLHLELDARDHAHLHFFPLMEDLLIMGGGKCVTHGIGSFGAFGAGLIGNECRAVHRPYNGRPGKCPNVYTERWAVNITLNHVLLDEQIDGEGKLDFEGIPSPWQR